ncbi:HSPG2 [Cordylochernes scorpioides]|uniref:HSPG2 n=1 Tax=Cordylochernes scorpioides TaxID=51811 RepID=A0ABY6KGY8_9ARAC|nr:HSPG2 [Cordylochernes scorpioides]
MPLIFGALLGNASQATCAVINARIARIDRMKPTVVCLCTTLVKKSSCTPAQFKCSSGECVNASSRCDGRIQCRDGSDEYNCPRIPPTQNILQCDTDHFKCGDASKCIEDTFRCDGYYDCLDFSDEQSCESRHCRPSQYRCQTGLCIDRDRYCDGLPDCPDRSDEQDCWTCAPGQYVCANGQCINRELRCNGQPDCTDYSDEADCHPQGDINLKVYPERQTIRQGQEVVIRCRDEGTRRAPVSWSRADNRPLPPNSTDVHGRLTMPNIQPIYGGVYLCTAIVAQAPASSPKASFLTVQPYTPPTNPPTRPLWACRTDEATCKNGECILKAYVCDGDYDCTDRSDESSCSSQLCEPNEFQCDNQKCVLKVWRCDGENDCGDHSDEKSCTPTPEGSPCRYDEYRCLSGDQCIPKSFHCDGEFDCQDKSDEIGCTGPTISQPPVESITVEEGSTVTITCSAVGNPTPLISWRLNWAHIPSPPRVTESSDNGRGVLVIRDARPSDQGAWSCEAINSKKNVLATNDCILVVKPKAGICRPPFFNDKAATISECLRCFCMGASETCYSSDLQVSSIHLDVDLSIVSLQRNRAGTYEQAGSPNPDSLHYNSANREYRLDSSINQGAPRGAYFYWSLSPVFLGNKLTSYGGFLSFIFRYNVPFQPNSPRIPDIILKGETLTLYHVLKQPYGPNRDNLVKIRFWEGEWHKDEGQARGEAPLVDITTRQDILEVLRNVKAIYIRATYDEELVESSILNLKMDTAVRGGAQPGTQAIFVEKCTCPQGYTGTSCEECAAGYSRGHQGDCVPSQVRCNCHGHSSLCEPSTGDCLSCQHNTEGRQCERCRRGFFGDARRGTPTDCQPCPCPLITPPNSMPSLTVPPPTVAATLAVRRFSPTCLMDVDGEVTCDACPLGYEGRRCERCAPGYEGTPTIPGGNCRLSGALQCDPVGSLTPQPSRTTGLCQCKPLVTGARCDQCKPNSFQLHPNSPLGCIDCFCMGITKACSSSSWFRQQEVLQVPSPGLVITNQQKDYKIENIPQGRGEIVFSSFASHPAQTYYWMLPSKFLGDKITAYGGQLNYTLSFVSGARHQVLDEPDIIISGNHIELLYRHSSKPKTGSAMTVVAPMYETAWVRSDNQPATREHFLMALADLESLQIRATYTPDTSVSNLLHVSMDIAVSHSTGQERAFAVEQCQCPIGYRGLSCEDCDMGYARSGAGLYLGLCEPCFCNGHSSDCDPETGFCKNCQHNTRGDFCEECVPGYIGDATGGTNNDCQPSIATQGNEQPCQCDTRGSLNLECDFRNQCSCKVDASQFAKFSEAANKWYHPLPGTHIQGRNCDRCKEGYFHLEARNPEGCSPCFCFGVTGQCSSSSYYRNTLRLADSYGVILTNRYRQHTVAQGIAYSPATPGHLTFSAFPQADEQGETLFWALPESFLGNKLTSYGGKLRYTQYYTAKDGGKLYADADVEIVGNGVTIFYINVPTLNPSETRTFEIELREGKWQRMDSVGPATATREDMMNVLARVEALLIRASFHSGMVETTLRDVQLEVAEPRPPGPGPNAVAVEVEQCVCPPGYIGLSCEECAPGYIRDSTGAGLGRCTRCNCNSHSESCHATSGTCIRCRHNTVGEHCERCADGYYGDATRGTADDCKPCPCPLTVPSNQFSPTCFLDNDGQPTCNACPPGYEGRNCQKCVPFVLPLQLTNLCEANECLMVAALTPQVIVSGTESLSVCSWQECCYVSPHGRCAPNYQGNPLHAGSRCELTGGGVSIRVRVEEPSSQRVTVGSTVTFRCSGVSPEPSYTLVWTKEGAPMPPQSTEASGVLTIPSVRPEDAGTFICTGSDLTSVAQAKAFLQVHGTGQATPPKVRIEPRYQEVQVGDPVDFMCLAEGFPEPQLRWTGGQNNQLNPTSTFVNGKFHIPSARKTDEAEYFCTGSNSAGSETIRTILFVKGNAGQEPKASIHPPTVEARPGESVRLECRVSGSPAPTVAWSFSTGSMPAGATPAGSTLVISSLGPQHQGVYICTASNPQGTAQSQARVSLSTRAIAPSARVEPERQTAVQGERAEVRCIVTGSPTPTITWMKAGEELSPRHKLEDNLLIIEQVVLQDRGLYICRGENRDGSAQASAIIEVERREVPTIELYPNSTQVIIRGGSAIFQCRVTSGIPLPTVEWTRADGSPFTRSTEILGSGVLRFNRVTGEEQGAYVCTAENVAGRATAQAILHIQGSPVIHIDKTSPHRVRPGERVSLTCRAEGDPAPSVAWRRLRHPQVLRAHTPDTQGLSSIATLEIERVSSSDDGTYICSAHNPAGTSEQHIQLIVEEPKDSIPEVLVENRVVSVSSGQRAQLRCFTRGTDKQVSLQWSRAHNQPMPVEHQQQNGELIIDPARPEDAGEYVCKGFLGGQELFEARSRLAVLGELVV